MCIQSYLLLKLCLKDKAGTWLCYCKHSDEETIINIYHLNEGTHTVYYTFNIFLYNNGVL